MFIKQKIIVWGYLIVLVLLCHKKPGIHIKLGF